MSKELEAFERIKNAPTIYVGCASDIYTRYSFECKLIETALKQLEEIKVVVNEATWLNEDELRKGIKEICQRN